MPTKTVTAIKPIDDDPAYRAQRENLVRLQLRRDGLDRRIMELSSSRGNRNQERIDAAAQTMIDGGAATAIDENALETERTALHRERAIVYRALELHKTTLDAAREKAALEIRTSVVDRHRAIGRRIESAMTELRGALLAENEFRVELDVAGVGFGEPLLPLAFPIIGQPGDVEGPYWSLARWLKRTSEYLAE